MNKEPKHNTDNKGKLFVTVFAFASACVTNTYVGKPGHAYLQASILLHRDSKVAPIKFVPRHCTSAFGLNPAP